MAVAQTSRVKCHQF